MTDPFTILTVSVASLAGLAMMIAGCLAGWQGWLQLKRRELDRVAGDPSPVHAAGARIEIADLRERIRKLEAIASGVEL